MADAAVQLKVAGQTYRVVTSADEDELTRLASQVESVLEEVTTPGRQPSPQALVLAAITLAHELEEERAKRRKLETRYRDVLTGLLGRVDRALDGSSGDSAAAGQASGAVTVSIPARRSKSSGASHEEPAAD